MQHMRWLPLFILSFLFLSSCATEEKIETSLSRFVTEEAVMVLEIKNLEFLRDSLSNNQVLKRFSKLTSYQNLKKDLSFLEFVKQNSPSLLIFSKSTKDNLDFLYATEYALDFFAHDSLGPKTAEVIPITKEDITKYEFGDSKLFSKVIDNYILVGSTEDVLLQHSELPEANQPNIAFDKLYKTSNKEKNLSLYVNPKRNHPLSTSLLNDMPGVDISSFENWSTFDIVGEKDKLSFNGVSTFTDSISSVVSLFKNTAPSLNMTPSFAPMNTDALISYSFDDYRAFAKNQQTYLGLNQPLDSLFSTVEEVGLIYLNDEQAVLLHTYGTENIADFLVQIRKSATDYQDNIILELSDTDFLNRSFEPIVKNFNANFGTILDNVFIFSSSKGILQTIISDYKKDRSFVKNPNYEAVMKNASNASTMLLISDGTKVKKLIQHDSAKSSNLSKATLSDYAIVSQIVADGPLFHTNISAQPKGSKSLQVMAQPASKFKLDQPLATDPQFVTNHLNKKKEIVVQDINNMLYLFSLDGKLLWKKQLNGKVQGYIHQVDIFKNGRLQLAFTTNNEFLILDRNGQNISLFDKRYQGTSLNPLAVFDYDKRREYRFVVTQKDNVFMYDRKGKTVSGFKYTKAPAPIREAPQHMVVGNKDYLVFCLEDGTFNALNRKGEHRVKAKEKIEFSDNPIRLHKRMFTTTDTNGKQCRIDLNGNVQRITLSLSDFHQMEATSKFFVYMNENVLSINGTKTELELGAYTRPRIFEMGLKTYISVTDLQNQKVYLFDSMSKLLPNFPLFGNSVADLADVDNDGQLEMVTADSDNTLVVYELN